MGATAQSMKWQAANVGLSDGGPVGLMFEVDAAV